MPTWTKLERVRAAVEGKTVDRVPFCAWHHFKPHGSPHRLAQATIEFFGGFDFDIYKIMPDIPYPHPSSSIQSPDDWLLVSPLEPDAGNLGRMLDTVAIVRERVDASPDGPAPVLLTVFSPFTYAIRFAGGFEKLRLHLREHPIVVHGALAVIAENLARFHEAAIAAGADGIFFAAQGAGDNLATPEEYAEFARPYDLIALRGASRGWLTTLHVHASEGLDITPFLDYPAPVLSWSDRLTGVSLREVRGKAPSTCLMGGLNERGAIVSGTKAAIVEEMRDALAQVGGERFILANGCSVPDEIPPAQLRAAREAVDEVARG